ncbi:MAG: hypothetical protein Q8K48_03375 [Candidatus Planktophila sp.]|nr:hypothetical protein [Candidatus Planktophila sp.]
MDQTLAIGLSIVIVYTITILVGKKFRISSRYERGSHIQDPWNSLDKGVDPSEETSEERNK